MASIRELVRGTLLAVPVLGLGAMTAVAAADRPATAPGQAARAVGAGASSTTSGQTGTTPTTTTPHGNSDSTPAATAPRRTNPKTTPDSVATRPGGTNTTPSTTTPAGTVPPPAPPVVGTSVTVRPVAGTVRVRLTPAGSFVVLPATGGSIRPGAVVDARDGEIVLRSALAPAGATQAATVRGAVFQVRQADGGDGTTELVLRGGRPAGCAGATARAAVAADRTPPKPRALWVSDHNGRFRTRGRNSVATVRGTRWSTRETCAGTRTRVMAGAVAVRDLRRHRTVVVRAGRSYLARDAR
jgi:hypothetical protein